MVVNKYPDATSRPRSVVLLLDPLAEPVWKPENTGAH